MTYQVILPWPPTVLSPNARAHWRRKASAIAAARSDAYYACREAGVPSLPWDRMHVAIEFRAPSRRPYDLDNALARCKGTLDGLADATGVDDSKWTYSISRGDQATGGQVIVTVSEAAA